MKRHIWLLCKINIFKGGITDKVKHQTDEWKLVQRRKTTMENPDAG
jgi:hypothetical protein